ASAPARADARRRIALRFLRSPVEIHGEGSVQSIEIRRNRIVRSADGTLKAEPTDEPLERIECGLVLRSVGYRAVPLPDALLGERQAELVSAEGWHAIDARELRSGAQQERPRVKLASRAELLTTARGLTRPC